MDDYEDEPDAFEELFGGSKSNSASDDEDESLDLAQTLMQKAALSCENDSEERTVTKDKSEPEQRDVKDPESNVQQSKSPSPIRLTPSDHEENPPLNLDSNLDHSVAESDSANVSDSSTETLEADKEIRNAKKTQNPSNGENGDGQGKTFCKDVPLTPEQTWDFSLQGIIPGYKSKCLWIEGTAYQKFLGECLHEMQNVCCPCPEHKRVAICRLCSTVFCSAKCFRRTLKAATTGDTSDQEAEATEEIQPEPVEVKEEVRDVRPGTRKAVASAPNNNTGKSGKEPRKVEEKKNMDYTKENANRNIPLAAASQDTRNLSRGGKTDRQTRNNNDFKPHSPYLQTTGGPPPANMWPPQLQRNALGMGLNTNAFPNVMLPPPIHPGTANSSIMGPGPGLPLPPNIPYDSIQPMLYNSAIINPPPVLNALNHTQQPVNAMTTGTSRNPNESSANPSPHNYNSKYEGIQKSQAQEPVRILRNPGPPEKHSITASNPNLARNEARPPPYSERDAGHGQVPTHHHNQRYHSSRSDDSDYPAHSQKSKTDSFQKNRRDFPSGQQFSETPSNAMPSKTAGKQFFNRNKSKREDSRDPSTSNALVNSKRENFVRNDFKKPSAYPNKNFADSDSSQTSSGNSNAYSHQTELRKKQFENHGRNSSSSTSSYFGSAESEPDSSRQNSSNSAYSDYKSARESLSSGPGRQGFQRGGFSQFPKAEQEPIQRTNFDSEKSLQTRSPGRNAFPESPRKDKKQVTINESSNSSYKTCNSYSESSSKDESTEVLIKLEPDIPYNVRMPVRHIRGNSFFEFSVMTLNNLSNYTKLHLEVQKRMKEAKLMRVIEVGDYCIVKYASSEEDNAPEEWYRGVITKAIGKVCVYILDLGVSTFVTTNSVYECPPQLKNSRPLAIKLRCLNLKVENETDPDVREYFESLVSTNDKIVKVRLTHKDAIEPYTYAGYLDVLHINKWFDVGVLLSKFGIAGTGFEEDVRKEENQKILVPLSRRGPGQTEVIEIEERLIPHVKTQTPKLIKACISYVKSLNEFYITTPEMYVEKSKLEGRLNSLGAAMKTKAVSSLNDLAYPLFMMENDESGLWIRVKVLEVATTVGIEASVVVQKIDYGDILTVPITRLKQLSQNHLLPGTVYKCSLPVELVPAGRKTGQSSEEAMRYLKDLSSGEVGLDVALFMIDNRTHIVELLLEGSRVGCSSTFLNKGWVTLCHDVDLMGFRNKV